VTGTKPDFARVTSTLGHDEPDRVPLAEAAVDYEIMSQFLGRVVVEDDLASQVEFWVGAGYDFIPLTVGMMQPGRLSKDSQISKVIASAMARDTVDEAGEEEWDLARMALIRTEEDFEAFPWKAASRLDFSKFHRVQQFLPEGMQIIAMSGKIFTLTWMLMGFENFGLNLILAPHFVDKVFARVAEIQLSGVREIASIPNVAAVWAVDDLAFGSGPMINPQAFRKHLFPWYEEFGTLCHSNNLHFFFHSDGVLWDLIEDLIHLGIDALHPIDPTCMDIEEVKEDVGDRVCIIGNISNELLMNGTPEEIAELTKSRLKKLAPGGGYCLGSGNSVPNWARIENYRAMIDTGLRYGRYPVAI
jgi:uroporphyrinogen decarboxylase